MMRYTEDYKGRHELSPEKVAELKEHYSQCELPFLTCETCAELFVDQGYAETRAFRKEVEKKYGPTESESYL